MASVVVEPMTVKLKEAEANRIADYLQRIVAPRDEWAELERLIKRLRGGA